MLNYTIEMYIRNQTGNDNSIISPTSQAWPHQLLVCMSFRKTFLSTLIATIMFAMNIINGVYGPEPRSSGGNTPSNPQVSVLIPRLASSGIKCPIKDHTVVQTLWWRHNDHDSVSNHQPHECLLNRLFRRRSKKTSKLRVTGLCVGNSPGTGEFPAQRASYAENVSIWWRHHEHKR